MPTYVGPRHSRRNLCRESSSIPPMDAFAHDLRYALRTLARTPGFAALTIACLAIGIGVNSMMYSVVDAIVRPLPFADPASLVGIHSAHPANGIEFGNVAYPDFRDLKAQAQSLS